MKNKIITFVTSNSVFAFLFILVYSIVILTTIFTQGDVLWVNASLVMTSVLGVIVTLTGFVSYAEARESNRWPVVIGRLVSASVKSGSLTNTKNLYVPHVEYTYTYKGIDHTGNTFDFSAQSGSQRWAQKIVNALNTQGDMIKVSVKPNDPEVSVLKPGVRFVHWLRFIIGTAMVAGGLLAIM